MKAVKHHTDCKWILLYIERWLKAPMQMENGVQVKRDRGTPQGGVNRPLLANIFIHPTFDDWMTRHYPSIFFERYADDIVAHCSSQGQAEKVLKRIKAKLLESGLELHLEKTRIVYYKDVNRVQSFEHEQFDFLGFTFRLRLAKNKHGKYFVNFLPAISNKAANKIRKEIRSWAIHNRSDKGLADLAHLFNATVFSEIIFNSILIPKL